MKTKIKSKEKNVPITNYDIAQKMAPMRSFVGVYTKDELPRRLKKGQSIIVNLDNSDGPGTHWVAVRNGDSAEYFDSFGLAPPDEVALLMKRCNKTEFGCLYNTTQIQPINSAKCGWYCMKYLADRNKGVPIEDIVYSFSRVNHPLEVRPDDDIIF